MFKLDQISPSFTGEKENKTLVGGGWWENTASLLFCVQGGKVSPYFVLYFIGWTVKKYVPVVLTASFIR